jgi:hypothetical protein
MHDQPSAAEKEYNKQLTGYDSFTAALSTLAEAIRSRDSQPVAGATARQLFQA